MKKIAIYGAGGLGREVACLIKLINDSLMEPEWDFIGFFDDTKNIGDNIFNYGLCLGGIYQLNQWNEKLSIVIAIGNSNSISSIYKQITNPNIDFPNIFAPSVIFLDRESTQLGKGNIICSNCLVSCNVKLGDFNIFNGYVPIGHDVTIGSYNVIMPSVNLSGSISIGNNNFFGVQSVVLQKIKIGNNVRVGANSVIIRNTKDGCLYMGNPAKKIEL